MQGHTHEVQRNGAADDQPNQHPRKIETAIWSLILALILGFSASACSEAPTNEWVPGGPIRAGIQCNPLAEEWDCLYPFPSQFWTEQDSSTPTGRRLVLTDKAAPRTSTRNFEARPVQVAHARTPDGFSVGAQIAVRIPGGVSADELTPLYGDLAASASPESRTLVIDAETGEKIPHVAEVDVRPDSVDDRVLILRPVVRLQNRRRYVVALRGIRHADGTEVQPPRSFRAIRDGNPSGDVQESLSAYFEQNVFGSLERAGVPRDDLVLAWDFATESEEYAASDLLDIRRQVIEEYARRPPVVKISRVIEGNDVLSPDLIGRDIRGTIEVPLFLEDFDLPGPDDAPPSLHRGADGHVLAHGMVEIPFIVRVPRSVLDGSKRGRLVQYGHGFFGTVGEMLDPYPSRFAHQTGSVLIGTDWIGMAAPDRALVLNSIVATPEQTAAFVERVHQAMANFMAVAAAARGPLAQLPILQDAEGTCLYDPASVYFYGLSMGSILGKTYVALSPDVDRAVLTSGGTGFGLLMSRASPFSVFLFMLEQVLGTPAETTRFLMVLQTALDRIDSLTFLPHLLSDTYPGGPSSRRVLLQIGLSDSEVPAATEQLTARSLGIPLLGPPVAAVPGLDVVDGPIDGSALVQWDFGISPPDTESKPAAGANGIHESVRRQPSANDMTDRFLRQDGRIENTCGGVCRGTLTGGG